MVFPVDVGRPSARSLRRPRAHSSGGSGAAFPHAHPAPFVRGTVISQALRYPRGNGFYRRVLIAEDEVAPEGLGPRRRRPAKALRARCGLFLTITVCAAHQRCSRFSIKWPWPRWECDIAPSICSFRPNFDSHARQCWGVVRAPSSRLKARRRSTDSLHACGSARRDTGARTAAVLHFANGR